MLKIISVIVVIIMVISFMDFIKEISNKQYNKKLFLILYIVVYALVYVNVLNIMTKEITTILSLIIVAFGCKFFLKLNNKDLIYYSIIEWIIATILDILIMNLFGIVKLDEDIYRIIGSSIIAIIFLFAGRINFIKRNINQIKKRLYKITNSTYMLIIIIIIYFFLGSYCLNNINDFSIQLIVFVISLLFISLIILFVIQLSQIIFLKDNIKILTKNNEFYIEKIDEYRILKHNLIYSLDAVKAVGNKKVKLLVDEIINQYKDIIKMPKHFKEIPSGINGIVSEKVYDLSPDVKYVVDNKIKSNIIETVKARDFNLYYEALGITLDNAIEALEKCDNKILYISITEDSKIIKTTIINTFRGNIDIDKIGTKNYTSKKEGNGLGLYSIFRMKSVRVKSYIIENKYITEIEITKNKNC